MIIAGESKEQFIDLPLLHFKVATTAPTKQLSTPRTRLIVAIVEALREVGIGFTVEMGTVTDFEVRMTEGRAKGVTTPDGLVLVD